MIAMLQSAVTKSSFSEQYEEKLDGVKKFRMESSYSDSGLSPPCPKYRKSDNGIVSEQKENCGTLLDLSCKNKETPKVEVPENIKHEEAKTTGK